MARVFTDLAEAKAQTGQAGQWVYNCLDNVATRKVYDAVLPRLDERQLNYYRFVMASGGVAFTMSTRGLLTDRVKWSKRRTELGREYDKAARAFVKLAVVAETWDGKEKETGLCEKSKRKDGRHTWEPGVPDTSARLCTQCGGSRFRPAPLNINSDDQIKHLLYDLLKMPVQKNKEKKSTVDKDALQKLVKHKKYGFLAEALLGLNDIKKQIEWLDTRITPDGRYMAAVTVGTAWTGRWSSSSDAFHYGSNAQNITERHRDLIIADPGMTLCYMDLKSAESEAVAHMSGDEGYIEAHKGDTHTFVSHMVWDDLPWPENPKEWKKWATSHFPEWDNRPGHDWRYQAKAVQHGSNLGLTPFGLAIQKRITVRAATEAQARYWKAFPRIRGFQDHIRAKVENMEEIVSIFGYRVRILGRPKDDRSTKQALAFLQQSVVGNIIAAGAWLVWMNMDPHDVQLLLQIHDAILFQYPTGRLDLVKRVYDLMRMPVVVRDYDGVERTMQLKVEVAIGQNWGHQSETNPDGVHEVDLDG